MDLPFIPRPQQLEQRDGALYLDRPLVVVLSDSTDEEDRFAAGYLCEMLTADHGLDASVDEAGPDALVIRIARAAGKAEGYVLEITDDGVAITGNDTAGVYYATQTLRQCVTTGSVGLQLPHLRIEDAPDLKYRTVHYDTKYHQDTYEYVQGFIRELAHYKANILIWEWEDKLAYKCHPQLGAPGAFTIEQMQDLTRYARQHHIQIVPLVQGLGHVAFILKHKEFRHLREIPDSDWEFCPLKEGSYELLFEIWKDAMEATPGSDFFHIGSDETYELGLGEGCGCKAKAEKDGKESLMNLFVTKCADFVASRGRTCLSWGGRWNPQTPTITPPREMVWTDGQDVEYLEQAGDAGYPCWVYAPNTGIVPLIVGLLPWHKHSMWRGEAGSLRPGGFFETMDTISRASRSGAVEGSITTSWDDSGLHNQMWMPRFVCAAEFSWNHDLTDLDEWIDRFYANYFGPRVRDMRECQQLLQDGAQFFEDTLQRRVWHWGDVGKMHLPDFPRDGLEYNPFWKRRYAGLLQQAQTWKIRMERALTIIDKNLGRPVKHAHDLEVMASCARLMLHNTKLFLLLADMETHLDNAYYHTGYSDRRASLAELRLMEREIGEHLAGKEKVYADLVACWEKTRLPKGCSTGDHKYFYKRERARHFANRTADMRYLLVDEDLLDLEGYLERLKVYNDAYEQNEVDA